ncbi:MAG: OB-fold nucleic acid binding domain-containing protein, partial [bacterium]
MEPLEKREEGYCQSCGRYIGAYKICPYCGARIDERLSVKVLKIFSLAFTFVGVIAVYFVAKSAELKKVPVSDIKEEMNYAVVCVEGIVTRAPSYNPEAQSIIFYIEDTTGSIRLTAYRNDVDALRSAGKVPRLGDKVEACGTVRVVEGNPSIIINIPERLVITPPPAPEITRIEDITDTLLNKPVKIRAKILSIKQTAGPINVLLGSLESNAKISMPIFKNQFTPPELNEGDTVEVTGVVSKYKEQLQIQARDSLSIVVVGKAPELDFESAQIQSIGSITRKMVGEKAKIKGDIISTRKIKNGILVNVSDGTGKITILVWDSVIRMLQNKELLSEGNIITALGTVELYKETLELKLENADDIELVPGKKEPTKRVAIGKIDKSYVKKSVEISGKITRVKDIKNGKLFELSDETGKIDVVIWRKALKYVKNPELIAVGNEATLKGEVDEYKGTLEIIIKRGEELKLSGTSKQTTSPLEATISTKKIGEITSSMV